MSRDMAALAQLDALTTVLNKAAGAHSRHLAAVLGTSTPDPRRSKAATRRAEANSRRARQLLAPLVRTAD